MVDLTHNLSNNTCASNGVTITYNYDILIGGIIGFISGIIGIGGGIFLSPILFLIKAGKAKHIVTTSSLFILINSIAGVSGQFTKDFVLSDVAKIVPNITPNTTKAP